MPLMLLNPRRPTTGTYEISWDDPKTGKRLSEMILAKYEVEEAKKLLRKDGAKNIAVVGPLVRFGKNPRRPTSEFMRRCTAGVGAGYGPGAVCAASWQKMSAAARRKWLSQENPGRQLSRREVEEIDRGLSRQIGKKCLSAKDRKEYEAWSRHLRTGSYALAMYHLKPLDTRIMRLGRYGRLWPATRGDLAAILAEVKARAPGLVKRVKDWAEGRRGNPGLAYHEAAETEAAERREHARLMNQPGREEYFAGMERAHLESGYVSLEYGGDARPRKRRYNPKARTTVRHWLEEKIPYEGGWKRRGDIMLELKALALSRPETAARADALSETWLFGYEEGLKRRGVQYEGGKLLSEAASPVEVGRRLAPPVENILREHGEKDYLVDAEGYLVIEGKRGATKYRPMVNPDGSLSLYPVQSGKRSLPPVSPLTRFRLNPGRAWHRAQRQRYGRFLSGDLAAGHGEAAGYWQGAESAEARAVAAGNPGSSPPRIIIRPTSSGRYALTVLDIEGGVWRSQDFPDKRKARQAAQEVQRGIRGQSNVKLHKVNPSPVEGARLKRLSGGPEKSYQGFHGREVDSAREVRVPADWPRKLWTLGRLNELIISSGRRGDLGVKLHGGTVAVGPRNGRLYVIKAMPPLKAEVKSLAREISYTPPSSSGRSFGGSYVHHFDRPPQVKSRGGGFLEVAGQGLKLTRRGIVG
jgi:hypothetical protein